MARIINIRISYVVIVLILISVVIMVLPECKKEVVNTQYVIPELYKREIDSLKKIIDSISDITYKRDTFIYERIKKIPYRVNDVISLNSDSSYRLFAKWNTELQDSSTRAGYVRLGSGPMD